MSRIEQERYVDFSEVEQRFSKKWKLINIRTSWYNLDDEIKE
jgi:hypothetical protein